ncbi:CPBP family intramembrane glutamic endopeptidase [Salirhabdus salicampi]|uniref:CPBP family intramembrane glutamic endopeptidase n=1 Tax=Salirhabdus salicampi TaxID=476102 RepID=UPI0020C372AA|nr:type II CAAX endopeptidase family protein [Salirhabdus salicampi]MCP8617829.1 CPBP family intramembrane metalloprotease [Salirhabdus salicampi]
MPKRYWYVILTYVLAQFSIIIGAPLLQALGAPDRLSAAVWWNLFSFSTAFIILLLLLKPDMRQVNERNASVGYVLKWSLLGIVMAFFTQYFVALFEIYVLNIDAASENTIGMMEIARQSPIFLIVLALLAPILEELVFRKVIFGSIYKRTNSFLIAAVISALIFGVLHGEFEHLLRYASMGIVFAYLYVKTKRIIVPIVAHMSMNGLVAIVQYNLSPEDIEKMRQQLEQLQTIFIGG